MRSALRLVVLTGAILGAGTSYAVSAPVVLDFDEFDDSTVLGTLGDVTFTNAVVLTAGISLNEFDFPPRSEFNAIADIGGAMRLDFATAIENFGGYFTYIKPITIAAFDASNTLLGSVMSAFSDNTPTAGGTPNELLALSIAGISYLTITGDPLGGSFTLDDMSYEVMEIVTPVPEPATLTLLGIGIAVVMRKRLRNRRTCRG